MRMIVGYGTNTKKGYGTITLKGKGEYGGTRTVKFKIVNAVVSPRPTT